VQSLLVGLLTTAACILTGIYIWLLRYAVLQNVHTGQLVAGIIFTIALIPRYYTSLAGACWQRGLFGVLSPTPFKSAGASW
jgi:hypothetical protein